ncbi:MAG: sulfur carrier protein [Methanolobus sp.]|jgi:sulfur carrier protein|nr:sulfur carrier protein [Methanolobus sp.]MDK2833015.1 sulfur carrier protein [Methanolobus sp.]MDK2912805.1 sulfur carrier protein [Methanolobus sp.]
MKIKLPSGTTEEISIESISVEGLLRQLGISQSEVLVVMNGEVIPEDRILDNGAQVRIIHVVFGG